MSDTTSHEMPAGPTAVDEAALPESNRRILAWIRAQREEPHTEEMREWGERFRKFIAEHPFSFGEHAGECWYQGSVGAMGDAKTEQAEGNTAADMNGIAPRRRELLRWLAEDARKPDELGEKWWDEFEAFLREHRLKVGDRADGS